jgi:hypothetical protein
MHKITYGEGLLSQLLNNLSDERFYAYAEPRIDNLVKNSRYPDFVLVDKEKGILCIEVKDWKRMEAEDQRTFSIFSENGNRRIEDNPYETAREYTFRLKDKFLERRELVDERTGKRRLIFPVEPLVVLTHQPQSTIDKLIQAGIFSEGQVITSEYLNGTKSIYEFMKKVRWTFKLDKPLNNLQIEAIQKTLAILEIRKRRQLDKTEAKVGMITKDQEYIIWSPIPYLEKGYKSALVRGVAGSGKTIVLTKKANLLSQLRPDLKILVTVFNKDLSEKVKEQVAKTRNIEVYQYFELVKIILGDEYPQYWEYRGQKDPRSVKNWCGEYLGDSEAVGSLPLEFIAQEISRRKELQLITKQQYVNDLNYRCSDLTDSDIDEIDSAYELYIEYQNTQKEAGNDYRDYEDTSVLAARRVISPKCNFRKKYDIIMVDEGQDFSSIMTNILKSMLKVGGYLFICDDPLQTLWRDYDIQARGLENSIRYYLNLPLRTTKEIAELAQSLFEFIPDIRSYHDNELYPAPTDDLESGDPPKIIEFSSAEEELSYVYSFTASELKSNDPNEYRVAIITPKNDSEIGEKVSSMGCYYGHFNIIKGLEFETVVICRLDEVFYNKWNSRGIMRRMQYRKLFVAITRARKKLILTYSRPIPSFLETILDYGEFDIFA